MSFSSALFRSVWISLGFAGICMSATAQNDLFGGSNEPEQPQLELPVSPQIETETTYAAPVFGGGKQPEHLRGTDLNENVDGATLRGQLRTSSAPQVGVVLIPDWWGLTEDAQAESGFWGVLGARVVTADLLEGKLPANRGEAARLNKAIDDEAALKALTAAFELARHGRAGTGEADQPGERKALPTVIIGFGTGADWALKLAAAKGADVAGLALYYGGVSDDPALVAKLKAPVYGIFAERDAWITPQRVDKFKARLAEQKLKNDFTTYNTHSGFALNNTNVDDKTYVQQAREMLWEHLNPLAPAADATAKP